MASSNTGPTRDDAPDLTFEQDARRTELRWQKVGTVLGVPGLLIGMITAFAAVYAAGQAAEAVQTAQEAVLRSNREQRMTTGIQSMGGETAAQRIAGIGLLSRSVSAELERVAALQAPSGDDEDVDRERRDAVAAYLATLDALENYVGTWPDDVPDGQRRARTGRVPKDVYYAGGEILRLLNHDNQIEAQADGAEPGLDLTGAHLAGISWARLDVSWVRFFAPLLDLRGANLSSSRWGTAMLWGADLRDARLTGAAFAEGDPAAPEGLVCADLRGADLADADLRGVDLRGALLRNADLTGADLTDAMLWGADLTGSVVDDDQLDAALSAKLGQRPWDGYPEPYAACIDRVTPDPPAAG
jgi:uncharacterized protein YjbI with pentapeptide repeats